MSKKDDLVRAAREAMTAAKDAMRAVKEARDAAYGAGATVRDLSPHWDYVPDDSEGGPEQCPRCRIAYEHEGRVPRHWCDYRNRTDPSYDTPTDEPCDCLGPHY